MLVVTPNYLFLCLVIRPFFFSSTSPPLLLAFAPCCYAFLCQLVFLPHSLVQVGELGTIATSFIQQAKVNLFSKFFEFFFPLYFVVFVLFVSFLFAILF